MSTKENKCTLCGEPMPKGEEMFQYHGYSGDCPKKPIDKKPDHYMMQFFKFSHLPDHLKTVSSDFHTLAVVIDKNFPENPEKTMALRKLLEAKDCAVRAAMFKGVDRIEHSVKPIKLDCVEEVEYQSIFVQDIKEARNIAMSMGLKPQQWVFVNTLEKVKSIDVQAMEKVLFVLDVESFREVVKLIER